MKLRSIMYRTYEKLAKFASDINGKGVYKWTRLIAALQRSVPLMAVGGHRSFNLGLIWLSAPLREDYAPSALPGGLRIFSPRYDRSFKDGAFPI